MTDGNLTALVTEFRAGYQIPSYYSDDACKVLLNESIDWFSNLADFDPVEDLTGRNLVKERAFYAYNHQLSDFSVNYEHDVLTWQLSKVEVVTDDDDEE